MRWMTFRFWSLLVDALSESFFGWFLAVFVRICFIFVLQCFPVHLLRLGCRVRAKIVSIQWAGPAINKCIDPIWIATISLHKPSIAHWRSNFRLFLHNWLANMLLFCCFGKICKLGCFLEILTGFCKEGKPKLENLCLDAIYQFIKQKWYIRALKWKELSKKTSGSS